MKRWIKSTVLITSIIILFIILLMLANFISGINDIEYPSTILLPSFALIILMTAIILINVWCFKYKSESRHRNLLITTIILFSISILAFRISPKINSTVHRQENQTSNIATIAPSTNNRNLSTSNNIKSEQYEIIDKKVSVWNNSINKTWCSVMAEVKNTGTSPLYLSASDFDLEDASGTLVAVIKLVSVYPSIINPGETAVYYKTNALEEVDDINAELNLIPHIKSVKSKNNKISFPASEVKIVNDNYLGVKAVGRIENNTSEEQNTIYVAVVCRDSNSKILAVLMTIINSLPANEKAGFEAVQLSLPENLKAEDIASFETFAYPAQLQF